MWIISFLYPLKLKYVEQVGITRETIVATMTTSPLLAKEFTLAATS